MADMIRRCAAEAIGSAMLSATVIGSGIMGAQLAGGNVALALLANTAATVCMLFVLITLFAPVSGAQFNPAVSLAAALAGELKWRHLAPYVLAQILGMLAGGVLAHLMFDLPLVQLSTRARGGVSQGLSELVATFGLLLAIFGVRAVDSRRGPAVVALYIGAAYWFTASTSFANPAITLARMLTDTFAGIRPADVPMFLLAQLGAATIGGLLLPRLFGTTSAA